MRILIARSDGGVSIMEMIDAGNVAAEIAKWEAASGLQAVEWHEVAVADLPQDRVFRDAWTHAGAGGITIDLEKAKQIQTERLKMVRIAELKQAQLDQAAAEVPDVSNATSVEQLSAILSDFKARR